MRTDNAADVWPDAALKNFIFYIFLMYEFSHSLGHSLPIHFAPILNNVRFAPPKATVTSHSAPGTAMSAT
jgi:hypothetical protein